MSYTTGFLLEVLRKQRPEGEGRQVCYIPGSDFIYTNFSGGRGLDFIYTDFSGGKKFFMGAISTKMANLNRYNWSCMIKFGMGGI